MIEGFDDFGAPLDNGKLRFVYTTQNEMAIPKVENLGRRNLRTLTHVDFEKMYLRVKNERYDDFGALICD